MVHFRGSLGLLSTIEACVLSGTAPPWTVDNTHPVFVRVLALLQVGVKRVLKEGPEVAVELCPIVDLLHTLTACNCMYSGV